MPGGGDGAAQLMMATGRPYSVIRGGKVQESRDGEGHGRAVAVTERWLSRRTGRAWPACPAR